MFRWLLVGESTAVSECTMVSDQGGKGLLLEFRAVETMFDVLIIVTRLFAFAIGLMHFCAL